MMYKNILHQRLSVHCLITYLLALIFSSPGLAQQPVRFQAGAVESQVLHIKVTEAYARQLESSPMSRTSTNVVQTGLQALDRVNQQYKTSQMKRVFPHAGKFEAKHRKHGLHLWYEVRVDQSISLQSAATAFQALDQVTVVEPVNKKKLFDIDPATFKPIILDQKTRDTQKAVRNLTDGTALPFNDEMLSYQWHFHNTGQRYGKPGADIRLLDAWKIETGKKEVIVAVTDGGIQTDHPDLKDNLWVNTGEVPGNGIDDDGNGYIDDVHGFNFVDNDALIDPHFHGTHVAGTVAATNNNGVGVSGIAGGSGNGDGVRLMTCAVFKGDFPNSDRGSGGFEHTYIYAADNGAVISQNSWGYTLPEVYDQVVLDAIDYFIAEAGTDEKGNQTGPMKGGIVIFAAGNDDSRLRYFPNYYPKVLAVAATSSKDTRSSYSNYGDWVDIAAPGGDGDNRDLSDIRSVVSTWVDGQYAAISGTSMACPHVSGVAALVVSKFGGTGYTPEMLRKRLTENTDIIDGSNPDYIGKLGAGRLNAWKALQTVDVTAPPPITNLEVTEINSNTLTLTWTVPAETDTTLSAYDIRYSTTPITEKSFEEAMPAPWKGEWIPQSAGGKEYFTVTGLQAETTYYVAIKTVDYSGNQSALSNAVQAKTNQAPTVLITPLLKASLQTGQTEVQFIWMRNIGPGVLEFSLEKKRDSLSFDSLSPDKGTLAPGDSLELKVVFDASGLLTGTYEQSLTMATNDPKNEQLRISLVLEVSSNEAPIVRVEPDTLDFGAVIAGAKAAKTITVHNAGSDTLTIQSASVEGSAFSLEWTNALVIAPFRDTTLQINFTPAALGAASGSISIQSDDPVHPVLSIALFGEGIPVPGISVSPDSLYAALNSNEKTVKQLTIRNTGGSDLTYTIHAAAPQKGKASVKQIQLSPAPWATDLAMGKAFSSVPGTHTPALPKQSASRAITLKTIGSSLIPLNVLIVSPDHSIDDFLQVMSGFDDLAVEVFPKDSLPYISAAALAPYHVVIVTNNFRWLGEGKVPAEKVGDALADYVDGGGKVIISSYAYIVNNEANEWHRLKGRFMTGNYGPFRIAKRQQYAQVSLGQKLVPDHPILEGVDSLAFANLVLDVEPAPGATALAEWTSPWAGNFLLAAANAHSVAINILPAFGHPAVPIQSLWSGDVPTLFHNAIRWLVPAPYVRTSPQTGSIPPGGEQVVNVELDATGLDSGHYPASLAIHHNIPAQGAWYVPLSLDVSGPAFTITPDSLSLTMSRKEKMSRTLVLRNNGTRTYAFSIRNENTHLMTSTLDTVSVPAPDPHPHLVTSTTGEEISLEALSARYRLPSQGTASTDNPYYYKTDFEDFDYGNINWQHGWAIASDEGLLGWNIDTAGHFATSGRKYVHRVSSKKAWSNLYSPIVKVGQAPKYTARMKLNFQGEGATWEIVFRSTLSYGFISLIVLKPDGSLHAAVRQGNRPVLVPISERKPQGSFELTFELDRQTDMFTLYMNDRKVFYGQAVDQADMDLVVFGSGTESDTMHLYIDDFEIRGGAKNEVPGYLSLTPHAGELAPGEQTEITVEFDPSQLTFGTYHSDLVVDVAGAQKLIVPTELILTGPSAISLNRTVLQNTIQYKKSVENLFEIQNTGGAPLDFHLDVLGGTVSIDTTSGKLMRPFNRPNESQAIARKQTMDAQLSKSTPAAASTTLQVLAGKHLLKEDFEGSFPPKGWRTGDTGGSLVTILGEGNYSGSGQSATFRADASAKSGMERQLLSPVIDVKNSKNITLQYQANYQNYANQDFLDLDIRVNGEQNWKNVLHWQEDHGTLYGLGELVQVNLNQYLPDASAFQLRWRYTTTGNDGWYAQLDNVELLEDAVPWLTVSPVAGTLVPQATATIRVTFDATYLEHGEHTAGIVVHCDAANTPQMGVVASLNVLKPAQITISHDSIYAEIYERASLRVDTITITNTGGSDWPYFLTDNANWMQGFTLPFNTAEIVEAGSNKQFIIEFYDHPGPGIYHDTIYINSVEPFYPSFKVPVTMKILPSPQLSVKLDTTIMVEVYEGQMGYEPYRITNTGGAPLDITMVNRNSVPWLGFSPEGTQSIQPDSSLIFTLHLDATDLVPGVYHDTLFYRTNDPYYQLAYHPITLMVLPRDEGEVIESFSLVNVTTGTVLSTFSDSLAIDAAQPDFLSLGIVANVREPVGSVRFSLDGGVKNLVNKAPYRLSRLSLPGLSEGAHVLSVQAYSRSGGRGELLGETQVLLYLHNSATIAHLELISLQGEVIRQVPDQDTLYLNEEQYGAISLQAGSVDRVGSVKFYVNGQYSATDTQAPFTLTQERGGEYLPWALSQGDYTITIIPYSLPYGEGIAGQTRSIHLQVVAEQAAGAGSAQVLGLYPVPARESVHLQVRQVMLGTVQVRIYNSYGQLVYSQQVGGERLNEEVIPLSGLPAGGYYLHLIAEDGSRQVKSFVKQ